MRIGNKAESLIVSFEGWDVCWKWPGQSSGITIARGYDLGYEPFSKDWVGLLPESDFNRLRAVEGLKGKSAARVAPSLRGIHVSREAGGKIFETVTIPRYENQTIETFPNSDKLPPNAFGALVSLVYNRGGDLSDRPGRKPRSEMREIRQVLLTQPVDSKETLKKIADLVRAQSRYWADNKDSDGDLHDRREDEAALIESCI